MSDRFSHLVHRLEEAEHHFNEEKARFAEKFAKNPAYAVEWNLADVLHAQALFEVAAEFGTDEDALALFAKSEQRRLQFARSTSRSTSPTANLVEDVRHEVRFGLLGEYLEARDDER